MLKVLLYGLATFMETGIGVWIFSQTFSERRILEKKYYVLEWLLYSLIFFGIYNFSVSLWQIDKKIEKTIAYFLQVCYSKTRLDGSYIF